MSNSKRSILPISMLWLTMAVIAIAVLTFRLHLSFDLSTFFPQKTSLMQNILLEQLNNGPGSRLIVIGLSDSDPEQLVELSDQLKQALAEDPAFTTVLNGDWSMTDVSIPEPVNSYYLLMDDIDYSQGSIKQALQSRYEDLALGGGTMLLELMARDPFLQTIKILQRLVPVSLTGDIWFAEDGSAVLLAETRAAATDIAAQAYAIQVVREAFTKLSGAKGTELEITGVGAFGVELQKTIRAEAKKRTLLASSVLLLVLLLVYRRARLLFLATLPLAMGFLVGLAVVSVIFDAVHGITLAFGFTLMGIAIDYPLHLFSHARQSSSNDAIATIWPTLRLGAASTTIAYLAIALSGSSGLAQLGVFSAVGVIVAALVTHSWLPLLMAKPAVPLVELPGTARSLPLTFLPATLSMVLAVFATQFMLDGEIWEDRLSSLSPVPQQRLETDNRLRSAAGTADMRFQIILHQPDLEALLLASETLDTLLEATVDEGLLGSWQSVGLILPSQSLQQTRQNAIPEHQLLKTRLDQALAGTPFKRKAFAPFETIAHTSRTLSLLTPEQFEGTPLSSWLDAHLIHLEGQWVSLISLSQPRPEELAERLKSWQINAELVDLHQSSLQLVRNYRTGAIKTIAFATLAIIALLLFARTQIRKILWIVVTVIAALSVTVAIIAITHGGITIIHLVALLLVLGLGLDYALFFGRSETQAGQQATRHAVLVCAITTTLTFTILAMSSIPFLRFLGLTVAVGSAASFVLAYAGSRLRNGKLSKNTF